ncbi:hypothetical protein VNO77_43596 [Canavalia gladiata]|uniref:Uncharacterized protein n=1 Tax=Canavalia gladiata TaxID=3824 RepID=A0AAN9PQ19_CANGL
MQQVHRKCICGNSLHLCCETCGHPLVHKQIALFFKQSELCSCKSGGRAEQPYEYLYTLCVLSRDNALLAKKEEGKLQLFPPYLLCDMIILFNGQTCEWGNPGKETNVVRVGNDSWDRGHKCLTVVGHRVMKISINNLATKLFS